MAAFEVPGDLAFNRGAIEDPAAFAAAHDAASWLFLCGEAFADMPGGISFAQVAASVPTARNLVADPPVEFDLDAVAEVVAAIDELPRPALVTCRTGPRSSAAVYLYAGLRAKATPEEVLARADADGAPFAGVAALRELVADGLRTLATD